MSHPFGDLLSQRLSRKHGLSQYKLADGIDQAPAVVSDMCRGRRLNGPKARDRVVAIIGWLHKQGALMLVEEANALLEAAGMAALNPDQKQEALVLQSLQLQIDARHLEQRDPLSRRAEQVKVLDIAPLHQIPSPPRDFTGRSEDLAELMEALDKGVTIIGLFGMGGIGKTALALVLTERLTPQYPDAQFYFDLKGTSKQPMSATDAMAQVIRSYDAEAKIANGIDDLTKLYRSILHDKRALLLMDNAANAAQLEPLIPPISCMLLVTSRQHFALPGLVAKNIEEMSPDDAHALLLKISPRLGDQAGAIAELCGYVPLALRLTASTLAERIDLELEDYVHRLTDAQMRLQLINASLSLSYKLLSAVMQKLWLRLAVFPDTFDTSAAAALWEIEQDQSQDTLSELVKYSLLEWDTLTHRYHMHDLVHLYASKHLNEVDRSTGQLRHATYYLNILRESNELYEQGSKAIKRGLDLFDREWMNIRAGQAWAAANAEEDKIAKLCSDYAAIGANLLALRQNPHERILWRESGLAAARRLGNGAAEALHLSNLGLAHADLGEITRAIELYGQALTIARAISNRRSEGKILNNLGLAYADIGEITQATELYLQALAIAREINNRRSEGKALGNLGLAYADLGETRRAIECYEQRLAIDREIGDERGEGATLSNLGVAYANLGEPAAQLSATNSTCI